MPQTKKNNRKHTEHSNIINPVTQQNNILRQAWFEAYPNTQEVYEDFTPTLQDSQSIANQALSELYFEILGFEQTSAIQILEAHAKQHQVALSPHNQTDVQLSTKEIDSIQHYGIIAQGELPHLEAFFNMVEGLFPNKLLKGNIAEFLIQKLSNQNLSICLAESCTGGNISSMLTSVNGASRVYRGGVTTYSIESKKRILNIKDSVFEDFSVYSEECVKAMARGALELFQSDIAIATSGLATSDKSSDNFLQFPSGLVFICVLMKNKMPLVISQNFANLSSINPLLPPHFIHQDSHQRIAIQYHASIEALRLTLSLL